MNDFRVDTLYIVHMNYDVMLQQQFESAYTTEVQMNEMLIQQKHMTNT